MPRPKAYEPIHGQKYQFLQWDSYNREYDHLDYAKDNTEKNYLLGEYRQVRPTPQIKVIKLPQKYWKEQDEKQ